MERRRGGRELHTHTQALWARDEPAANRQAATAEAPGGPEKCLWWAACDPSAIVWGPLL